MQDAIKPTIARSGDEVLIASEKCVKLASELSTAPGQEYLAVHMLWHGVRLRLVHDCIRFRAGDVGIDAEVHDIAFHLARMSGNDSYTSIGKKLVKFAGAGLALLEQRSGVVRPFTTEQYQDLLDVLRQLQESIPLH